jgi:hypothetical protein
MLVPASSGRRPNLFKGRSHIIIMKGLSTTLVIVITAVVILVAALVILTIFGRGVGQVATLAEASSVCNTQGRTSCSTAGVLPITWGVPDKNVEGQGLISCSDVLKDTCTSSCTCQSYGFPTPGAVQ